MTTSVVVTVPAIQHTSPVIVQPVHTTTPSNCPDGKCPLSTTKQTDSVQAIASGDASKALLIVELPDSATLSLVGQAMPQTGSVRRFTVAVAEQGKSFEYPMQVEVGGKSVSLKPMVKAGVSTVVRFQEENGNLVANLVSQPSDAKPAVLVALR
ncbi:MAG: hypothetical protein ACOVQM_02180 [Pirellula sp.]